MVKIKEVIKKNGEKSYSAQIYLGIDSVTQVQRQTVVRGRTKKEVKDKIVFKKNEFINNGYTTLSKERKTNKLTFNEVYEDWRVNYYEESVAESTLQGLLNIFNIHILPIIGNMSIEKISLNDCQKIVDHLMEIEYKGVKKVVNSGARVFEYAKNMGYVSINPFKLVHIQNKRWTIEQMEAEKKKEQLKFYDLVETIEFLDCAKKEAAETGTLKWYTFYTLLITTGLRFGEATALTWDDIDYNNHTISVNRAYSKGLGYRVILKTPKSKSSVRTIHLLGEVAQLLKGWEEEQRSDFNQRGLNFSENNLIFPNTKNKNLAQSTVRTKLNKFTEKYKLKKITPHCFRHTYSTLLYLANTGGMGKERQTLLGHSTMEMTNNVYTHSTFDEEKKAVSSLQDLIKL